MQKSKDEKIIMVSNIGSASRKYFVYLYSRKDNSLKELFKIEFDEKEFYPKVKLEDAILEFFTIAKKDYNLNIQDIDIIAERVVAVGEYFLQHRLIDARYLKELEYAKRYDILHTESLISELKEIFLIKEAFQKVNKKVNFKIIGISDSQFHFTIAKETYTYAIKNYKKDTNIRKYGYHGISMSEVANTLENKYKKVIAIHLGGGGSVSAIENGKSIYNSFGMTPASGIINLTRIGNIDAFVALDILNKNKRSFTLLDIKDMAFDNTKRELYEESGLFALTGEKDMRDILQNLKLKDKNIKEKSEFALDVYMNSINEFVGSAYAHLGGIDALVLTGAILEKSDIFREKLIKKLSWLAIKKEHILILKTEEEKEIARLVVEGNFVF